MRTMKPDHEHAQIIRQKHGGPAKLAKLLSKKEVEAGRKSISRQTVQAWIKRGIPAKIQLRYQGLL